MESDRGVVGGGGWLVGDDCFACLAVILSDSLIVGLKVTANLINDPTWL